MPKCAAALSGCATTASSLVGRVLQGYSYGKAHILTAFPGHESNNCPHPRTTESEHFRNNNEGTETMLTPDPAKQCYHCQGLGHVQADCPTLRLSGGTGGGRCYSCGQMGHLAVRLVH